MCSVGTVCSVGRVWSQHSVTHSFTAQANLPMARGEQCDIENSVFVCVSMFEGVCLCGYVRVCVEEYVT